MDGSPIAQGAPYHPDMGGSGGWGDPYVAPSQQQQQQHFDYTEQGYGGGYDSQYVQPHINPRFASAFAMNFGFAQANQYPPYENAGYNAGPMGDESSSGPWSPSWGSSADGDPGAPHS